MSHILLTYASATYHFLSHLCLVINCHYCSPLFFSLDLLFMEYASFFSLTYSLARTHVTLSIASTDFSPAIVH